MIKFVYLKEETERINNSGCPYISTYKDRVGVRCHKVYPCNLKAILELSDSSQVAKDARVATCDLILRNAGLGPSNVDLVKKHSNGVGLVMGNFEVTSSMDEPGILSSPNSDRKKHSDQSSLKTPVNRLEKTARLKRKLRILNLFELAQINKSRKSKVTFGPNENEKGFPEIKIAHSTKDASSSGVVTC